MENQYNNYQYLLPLTNTLLNSPSNSIHITWYYKVIVGSVFVISIISLIVSIIAISSAKNIQTQTNIFNETAKLFVVNTFTQPQIIPQISVSVYINTTQSILGDNIPTLLQLTKMFMVFGIMKLYNIKFQEQDYI